MTDDSWFSKNLKKSVWEKLFEFGGVVNFFLEGEGFGNSKKELLLEIATTVRW